MKIKSRKFSISILSEKTVTKVISKMGFQSSKDNDKYGDLKFDIVDRVPTIEEDICRYVHKGEMSLDFVCPICRANYTHFASSKTL